MVEDNSSHIRDMRDIELTNRRRYTLTLCGAVAGFGIPVEDGWTLAASRISCDTCTAQLTELGGDYDDADWCHIEDFED